MSNPLSARRVMVQTLNEKGEPDGEPTYGVVASSNEETKFCDIYESFEELNKAIDDAGCITDIVQFEDVNKDVVGTDNFYDTGWSIYHMPEESEENDELEEE